VSVLCVVLRYLGQISKAEPSESISTPAKQGMYPGYCEIEIINNAYSDLRIFGTFDDNTPLYFTIFRYDPPHRINLFYYSYCHNGMYLTIRSPYSTLFSGWVNVNSTVRIVPYLNQQPKVDIIAR
jgi:hypothetical protein